MLRWGILASLGSWGLRSILSASWRGAWLRTVLIGPSSVTTILLTLALSLALALALILIIFALQLLANISEDSSITWLLGTPRSAVVLAIRKAFVMITCHAWNSPSHSRSLTRMILDLERLLEVRSA
jgi:hypothetical protein